MRIISSCSFVLPNPLINHDHHSRALSKPSFAVKASSSGTGLIITGPSELSGHVSISGSKNAALPILAAALCSSGESRISNLPNLSDTRHMASVLRSLGAAVTEDSGEIATVVVSADRITSVEPDPEILGKIRGGFFVLGPILARFGEASVALPGGCDIGSRPVDLYLRGLSALGAIVDLRDGKVQAYAGNGKGLVGGRFRLDFPSVGATETLMMAASLADGVTVLSNAAKEPEVVEIARFLSACGAGISGAGTETIIVEGKPRLRGCEWRIVPDRIETGTFMIAAAITRSSFTISPVVPSDMAALTKNLAAAGCRIKILSPDTMEVSGLTTNGENLRGFDVRTGPFPSFPTDLQPQTMALLASCDGSSIIEEFIFEKRMAHAKELNKLGARIQVCGSTALVFGKDKGSNLTGCSVAAKDLRGGAALVLAGLAASGTTVISGSIHIDRGYESLDAKLRSLGADVKRLMPVPVLKRV